MTYRPPSDDEIFEMVRKAALDPTCITTDEVKQWLATHATWLAIEDNYRRLAPLCARIHKEVKGAKPNKPQE